MAQEKIKELKAIKAQEKNLAILRVETEWKNPALANAHVEGNQEFEKWALGA